MLLSDAIKRQCREKIRTLAMLSSTTATFHVASNGRSDEIKKLVLVSIGDYYSGHQYVEFQHR